MRVLFHCVLNCPNWMLHCYERVKLLSSSRVHLLAFLPHSEPPKITTLYYFDFYWWHQYPAVYSNSGESNFNHIFCFGIKNTGPIMSMCLCTAEMFSYSKLCGHIFCVCIIYIHIIYILYPYNNIWGILYMPHIFIKLTWWSSLDNVLSKFHVGYSCNPRWLLKILFNLYKTLLVKHIYCKVNLFVI